MSGLKDERSLAGIPLQEREPEQIKPVLANAGADDAAIEQFLTLHAYARHNHLGISALANQTSVSTAVLSSCYNGNYKGDYGATADRIRTFFWRLEQKAKYGGLREFCETRLAKTLWGVFEKTRIIRRIQIIQSPEQLGKTRAATEYTARNNSGRTTYVQLSGGSSSGANDFVWEIAERLDIPYTIKMREKRARIRHKLESCDLVIVDEAHLVFTWTDRAVRDFWDYLRTDIFDNGARGVVLIATNCEMLEGLQTFRGRARYNIGQLLGRMRNDIVTIDPYEDVTDGDVAMLVGRYYEPDKPTLALLADIARRPQLGHLGLIEDIMNEAWTKAKARGKKQPDDAVVTRVAEQILDALKQRKDLYK